MDCGKIEQTTLIMVKHMCAQIEHTYDIKTILENDIGYNFWQVKIDPRRWGAEYGASKRLEAWNCICNSHA